MSASRLYGMSLRTARHSGRRFIWPKLCHIEEQQRPRRTAGAAGRVKDNQWREVKGLARSEMVTCHRAVTASVSLDASSQPFLKCHGPCNIAPLTSPRAIYTSMARPGSFLPNYLSPRVARFPSRSGVWINGLTGSQGLYSLY